jgi:mannose-6-phosphate isomerase
MEQKVNETARVSLVVPRLDEKIWGGRRLERYGLDMSGKERVGEALVTAGEAVVAAGYGEKRTLQDLIDEDPAGHLGDRGHAAVSGRSIFPLLAKLIDASQNLSIQVHPDDDAARSLDRLGKTEAWHILDVEPGGKLFLGVQEDVTLDAFMEHARKLDGTSAMDMRAVDAVEGKTILLAAGTIHALGEGVLVYEIQQPSDVTFRLDDWGRVDAQGNPREMHLEQGEAASRIDMRPEWIDPITLDDGRQLLTACRYFALEKITLQAGSSLPLANDGSPQVVTLLSGAVSFDADTDQLPLAPGSSGVIWPSTAPVTLTAGEPSVLLRAWVPDLARDIVEPARAAGATDQQIAALAGLTGDLQGSIS